MATTTEQAFDALFELVSAAAAFKSAERDVRKWDAIVQDRGALPAIFQEQSKPAFESRPNLPTIIRLRCDLAIVCDSSDTVKIPTTRLNGLVDAVLTAIAPVAADDYRQTLGGLVYDAKPMGEGFYHEATLSSPLSYALIPIEILLTM